MPVAFSRHVSLDHDAVFGGRKVLFVFVVGDYTVVDEIFDVLPPKLRDCAERNVLDADHRLISLSTSAANRFSF